MIKSLLKLLAVLVLGILIYNLVLGTESEKEGAKKIFGEMKDVGVAVKDLLKTEKEKFDKGKYDKAVDKIGDMLSGLKRTAKDIDEKYLDRIERLEKKQRELREELSEFEETPEPSDNGNRGLLGNKKNEDNADAIRKDMQNLLKETESLLKEMESKEQGW